VTALPAPSPLRRLLVQSSHYSFASLLTMIGGLITFPVLTRTFSVGDYGIMNLIAATITVSVALGKIGLQHSIVRYSSEITAGKSPFSLAQLTATTFYGMLASALLVVMVVVLGIELAPARWLSDPRVRVLFLIAAPMIVTQVVESGVTNFLRAEQKTTALMKYTVAKKYLSLGLILFAVLLVSQTLASFYVASVIAEALAVGTLAWIFFRTAGQRRPEIGQFSRPLYGELLRFGIPMLIGYELSGIILSVGDRYVIQGLVGEEPLGLYSAAYNLCQYVQQVFIASVGQAIMPLYMQMWDQKGAAETELFIAKSLRSYVLFGAPIVAGVAAVGPELLPSLASDRYAGASAVLPWVIAGMVVDGANAMVGAGLFIFRKTRVVMAVVMSSATLNLVLNLILVPRIGIIGAAIATLVSYTAAALGLAIAGRRQFKVTLPVGTLLRAGIASAVMYVAVTPLLPGHRLITVAVRAVAGAFSYAIVMSLIDSDARSLLRRGIDRVRRRSIGAGA
jgi:O-antigen/teichoic acid export membrane protein